MGARPGEATIGEWIDLNWSRAVSLDGVDSVGDRLLLVLTVAGSRGHRVLGMS